MDPRFNPVNQELHNVQMEVKQVQFVQTNHEERLMRLERRQTEDAAIKAAWHSPFPSVLGGGTPQHGKPSDGESLFSTKLILRPKGPMQMPTNQVFDDFDDEQSQNLLSSLHLDADEEPVRRGAASRANSVRFDETTLQGSNWGQGTRHSGEFGPARPGSGLGGHSMMERSLSHKSDGRHSSAGHSVHSIHSLVSGRASSLGLDALGAHDDASSIEITEPAPGFLFLGSVPSIVRCWLTTEYAHDTLLYAVVCTGSQKSTVDYSLIKELDLLDDLHRHMSGVLRISIPVYFAEATVAQQQSRSSSPSRQVPYITTDFEVVGMEQAETVESKKSIRIFIGSDTLRANSADLLLSQNRMTLFGNGEDRDRLSVPFVRPEDDSTFKHITTVNAVPEKPKLNANAPEFVSTDSRAQSATAPEDTDDAQSPQFEVDESDLQSPFSPLTNQTGQSVRNAALSAPSESGSEGQHKESAAGISETGGKEDSGQADEKRRESTAGIWGSWRQGTSVTGSDAGQRENGLSGYQPAGRGGRNMKILKPQKPGASVSSARTGSSYESPLPSRSSGEHRRKSQGAVSSPEQNGSSGGATHVRWEAVKRSASGILGGTSGGESSTSTSETKPKTPATRSNPVGGASAFSWMNSGGTKPLDTSAGKPKTTTA